MNERRGVLLVLIAALLWSTGGIGIKAIDDPPLKIAFYRSAVAAVALALFLRPRVGRITLPFIASVVSYAGCLVTFVTATKWTTAANAIFLQYSGVVWVLLLSPMVLREKMTRRDVIAIVVALAGMVLFFMGKLDVHGWNGNLMALLSGVFFAALVLSLRMQKGGADEASVLWGNIVLALVLLPFVARNPGLALTSRSAFVLVALGVIQIGVAYYFFVRGLRRVSATQASLTGMLEPVMNPLWVFLLLGEKPSAWAIVGALIVLGAIGWRTMQGEGIAHAPTPPPD
jgi:drug/metabolite transporter (DMT)-like permease